MNQKYQQEPDIITGKDLEYLSDIWQWNYDAYKKYSHYEQVSEMEEYLGISYSTYLRKQVLGNLEKQGYLESSKISRAMYFKTNPDMVTVN